MLSLKKAGFVESISGARGGYILIKRPAEIKIFNIVKVLEGSISPVPCIDHKKMCKQEAHCSTKSLWMKVKKSIKDVLTSITLKDLTEEKSRKSSDVVK